MHVSLGHATERLEQAGNFNAMFTHRVRVPSTQAVDKELAGWLRRAYEAAGDWEVWVARG